MTSIETVKVGTFGFIGVTTSLSLSQFLLRRSPSYFIYSLSNSSLKLHSDASTLITHFFHHRNFSHFLVNYSGIVISALNLDLGFLKSSFLFIGGGIAGAFTSIIQTYYYPKKLILPKASTQSGVVDIFDTFSSIWSTVNKAVEPISQVPFLSSVWKDISSVTDPILSSLPELPKIPAMRVVYALCGSSACTFAFFGAELYSSIKSLRQVVRNVVTSEKNTGIADTLNKQKLEPLVFDIVLKSGVLVAEFLANDIQDGNVIIGHDAHIGGFIFGFMCMLFWDLN